MRQISEDTVRVIVQGSPIALLSELTDDWENNAEAFTKHATDEQCKIISYASKTIALEDYLAKIEELDSEQQHEMFESDDFRCYLE